MSTDGIPVLSVVLGENSWNILSHTYKCVGYLQMHKQYTFFPLLRVQFFEIIFVV